MALFYKPTYLLCINSKYENIIHRVGCTLLQLASWVAYKIQSMLWVTNIKKFEKCCAHGCEATVFIKLTVADAHWPLKTLVVTDHQYSPSHEWGECHSSRSRTWEKMHTIIYGRSSTLYEYNENITIVYT